jgi:ribosomal protein S18 acetylase RimI-like enzyme
VPPARRSTAARTNARNPSGCTSSIPPTSRETELLRYHCLIELRAALPDEVDTLLAIQREAAVGAYAHIYPPERYPFPDDAVREVWAEALSDPEVEVYVAEVDGEPAGAVSVGRGFLSTLYVLPAHQGRGVGSALHDLALDRLRALGSEEARLWTLEGNDAGRKFYERRGWSLTDETRVVPYPPNPIDVQYARPLEPASGERPAR